MGTVFDFQIKIANVPVRVRCRHQVTYDFLRPYMTQEAGRFLVEPSDADLERIRDEVERTEMAQGLPARRYSEKYLEQNAIHALLAEGLAAYDVLLMHGSALCMDGQAYLFTAKSGTGKSTHARLWRETFGDRVWMINDDKPMLSIREDGITVWGTPWDGKHHLSRNAGAPLKAIVQIKRDGTNHMEPMTRANAFPVLMEQAYSSNNPATAVKILAMESRILNTADFYTMYCNQEQEAARVAYHGIHKRPQDKETI